MAGYTGLRDMFDGGGPGRSGSSFEGALSGIGNALGLSPSGGGGGGGGNLLSGLGSLIGGLVGGPMGAAIGAGLGTMAGGGTPGAALQSGFGGFVTNKFGGLGGTLMNALGSGGTPQDVLGGLLGQGQQSQSQAAPGAAKKNQPMGGLLGLLDSPLVMAALLKATEPKNVNITTPAQRRQLETGERLPDYQGTPAFDYRYGSNFAKGGMVEGPGDGTSDSIKAAIYQDGRPVREARLSDGEFVMTNRAVRGAGDGDRGKGAAEMYRMMRSLERRA